ncbi:hypothetical protein, partial [Enterococcus casseliflavus]|uniref:hypothetical protein n=1 Tax=Enterococcus casseliflavus TaxID=37734 RepID=UPI003D0FB010
YVPGDDLPALGGEATAYRLDGDVDEARVRTLADALGLDGPVDDEGDGSWSVAGDHGSLDVYPGGWSYYTGDQDCAVSSDGSIGGCTSIA